MPTPTLLNFEEDANRINKLEAKNESLKKRLALLLDRGSESTFVPHHVEPAQYDVYDDFYIIAQENSGNDSQAKSLRNLIRNMSSNSSPILNRRDNSSSGAKKRMGSVSGRNVKNVHDV